METENYNNLALLKYDMWNYSEKTFSEVPFSAFTSFSVVTSVPNVGESWLRSLSICTANVFHWVASALKHSIVFKNSLPLKPPTTYRRPSMTVAPAFTRATDMHGTLVHSSVSGSKHSTVFSEDWPSLPPMAKILPRVQRKGVRGLFTESVEEAIDLCDNNLLKCFRIYLSKLNHYFRQGMKVFSSIWKQTILCTKGLLCAYYVEIRQVRRLVFWQLPIVSTTIKG